MTAVQNCERDQPQRPANQSGTKPQQIKIVLHGRREITLYGNIMGKKMSMSG